MLTQDPRLLDALMILRELEASGYEARLAGGCVRDRLMGVIPTDYDIVTSAVPAQVLSTMKSFGHKVIPTGIDHGTVTVLTPSSPVEVTTLRKDVTTDGRRAIVAFGAGFEEDSLRRDFTINGLFEDQNGRIYDFVGGISDLKQKILRFVGDPAKRIGEDALRILRFYRFWSRLGFTPAPGTLEALPLLTHKLNQISQERITAEIWQIFAGDFFVPTISSLLDSGTMNQVDPHLAAGLKVFQSCLDRLPLKTQSIVENSLGPLLKEAYPDKALAIIAWLLLIGPHHQEIDFWAWGTRFKIQNRDKKILNLSKTLPQQLLELPHDTTKNLGSYLDYLLQWKDLDPDVGTFYQRIWSAGIALHKLGAGELSAHPLFNQALVEQMAQASGLLKKYLHKIDEKLPISGKDIETCLNLQPGALIGEILKMVRHAWYQDLWITKESGIKWMLEHQSLWDPDSGVSPFGHPKKAPKPPTH